MKYIILIGDGMADNPIGSLGSRTPLDVALTPNLDSIASSGLFGLFVTVPKGFPPGSDVANLSILGYDPARYYSGRSPLEAASIGVKLEATDVAFRCNLVTLSDKGTIMDDYSAGHISTFDADSIIKTLDADSELRAMGVRFYTGTSYRHLMVWKHGKDKLKTTPPHDISDKPIEAHLPSGDGAEALLRLMKRSSEILKDHPTNKARVVAGEKPATSIWLWGQGRAPLMPTMKDRFGVNGAMISAVDLMKGIGIYAGLEVLKVPGVTGWLDTNYKGKAEYALESLKKGDFVCVHVEAPDEAGHKGNLQEKLTAIEDFDREVVGRVLRGIAETGEPYRVVALCDHPTPIELKTHTSASVPFVMASSSGGGGALVERAVKAHYCEREAKQTGVFMSKADAFIEALFSGR
ncbi:MAG: cofactor-independent phosphoglycerate mutase [Deltaproteobacteria bacterium]|nr:cofactor-independent phosphoglycerate mutase [Deltaproteobacteria bacterium]